VVKLPVTDKNQKTITAVEY